MRQSRRPVDGIGGVVVSVLVVTSLLVGAMIVSQPVEAAPPSEAARFLGADGHAERQRSGDTLRVTEAAHLGGAALLTSGPPALFLARPDVEEQIASRWVRTLATTVAGADVERHLTLQEVLPSGIHTSMEGPVEAPWRFEPARLDLPSGVRPGMHWEGQGTRIMIDGDTEAWSFTALAEAPDHHDLADLGCVTVRRDERVGSSSTTSRTTWCPGRGVVATGDFTPAPDGPASDVRLDDEGTWDPTRWGLTDRTARVPPPQVWSGPLGAVSTDRITVQPLGPSGDLLFMADHDPTQTWRAHPGGTITSLQRFGELLVAATSTPELVAYDTAGIRLWTHRLADVVVRAGTLDGDQLVVTDASSTITAIDLRSGAERWRTSLPQQVTSTPVACRGRIVVTTANSEVVAMTRDGVEAWSTSLADRSDDLACSRDGLIVVAGSRIELISDEGQRLDSAALRDGVISSIEPLGDGVVTHSRDALTAWSTTGGLHLAWRVEDQFSDVIVRPDLAVAARPAALVAYFADGTQAGEWTPLPAVTSPHLAATPAGVVLLGDEYREVRLQ